MSQRSLSHYKFLPWIYLTLVFAVALVVVVGILVSRVSGQEFNPQTLQRREFTLWRIPFSRFQFSPTLRQPVKSKKLCEYLRGKEWWMAETPGAANDWQVAEEFSLWGGAHGEVDFLARLVADPDFWLDWSQKDIGRSADFWPAVALQVQRQQYVSLPRLFALALERTDASVWKERFAEWQAESARP